MDEVMQGCTDCTLDAWMQGCKDTGCIAKKCKKACRPYTKHLGASFWWRRGGGNHRCVVGDGAYDICTDVFDELLRIEKMKRKEKEENNKLK